MTVEAWGDCLHIACPNCGQPKGEYCRFKVDDKTLVRHCPCKDRIRAAEAGL
jgi:hypothetical protein